MFTPTSQYNKDVIQAFEFTMGKHYMSAGGREATRKTFALLQPVLEPKEAARVLEVGCGIGGASFDLANEFGAHVTAVDINPIGIQMAQEALLQEPLQLGACSFAVCDILTADFAPGSFDVIYSRDVLLHLDAEAKQRLFSRFYEWLAPNGMVCITDYCLGFKSTTDKTETDPQFEAYLKSRGYHLLTPAGYQAAFCSAGFAADRVTATDEPLWYCQVSLQEMDRVVRPGPGREAFLAQNSLEDLEQLAKVYQDKIQMTLRGDRSYVIVTATKAAAPQPHYEARQQVLAAYQMLNDKGWIMSCDGNVSCRVFGSIATTAAANTTSAATSTIAAAVAVTEEKAASSSSVVEETSVEQNGGFLVTPSGIALAEMNASQIVWCGHTAGGSGYQRAPGEAYKPSSESGLHDEIYRARPDVGAIVHSHSIFVCALACCRLPLPAAHYAVCELLSKVDFSSRSGGSTVALAASAAAAMTIQCAPYHTYGSRGLSQSSVTALGQNQAVLLANHGAVVVGPNLEQALYNTERLERECEIYWRCLQMQSVGPPQPLDLNQIMDLQNADQTYGQKHPDATSGDAGPADNKEEIEATPELEVLSLACSEDDTSSGEESSS
jgi:phosphoethanolamine N-methyltransferase